MHGGHQAASELALHLARAVSLLSSYGAKQICSELGISKASLKNWQRTEVTVKHSNAKVSPSFVSLPLVSEEAQPGYADLSRRMHIKLPSGTVFELLSPTFDEVSSFAKLLFSVVQ